MKPTRKPMRVRTLSQEDLAATAGAGKIILWGNAGCNRCGYVATPEQIGQPCPNGCTLMSIERAQNGYK